MNSVSHWVIYWVGGITITPNSTAANSNIRRVWRFCLPPMAVWTSLRSLVQTGQWWSVSLIFGPSCDPFRTIRVSIERRWVRFECADESLTLPLGSFRTCFFKIDFSIISNCQRWTFQSGGQVLQWALSRWLRFWKMKRSMGNCELNTSAVFSRDDNVEKQISIFPTDLASWYFYMARLFDQHSLLSVLPYPARLDDSSFWAPSSFAP